MRISQVMQIVGLSLAATLTPVLVSAQQASTDTTPPADSQAKPAKPADKSADKAATDKSSTKPADKDKSTAARTTPDGRKLEKLEDPEPPATKIEKAPTTTAPKVSQIRDDSGIKETKVETGVSTYYVRPNTQVGTAQAGDTQSTFNRGAEWKVMEFNLGEKKKKSDDAPPADSGDKK